MRFRILEEIQTLPYRIARVAAAPEEPVGVDLARDLRLRLVDLSRRYLDHLPGPTELVELVGKERFRALPRRGEELHR